MAIFLSDIATVLFAYPGESRAGRGRNGGAHKNVMGYFCRSSATKTKIFADNDLQNLGGDLASQIKTERGIVADSEHYFFRLIISRSPAKLFA